MKFFQLLFIVFFSFGYGQKFFEFDYMVHYNWETDGKKGDNLYYINSKNSSDLINIYNNGGNLTAKLFSCENHKIYDFEVVQKSVNGEITFEFLYSKTATLRCDKKVPSFKYTIIDDSRIQLDIFKNKKQKKIIQSHLMTVKPYDTNLFQAYRINFHPYEFHPELDYPKNTFVEESTLTCENGRIIKKKLQEIRKVSLKITIPKKEIY